jgi:hypothetical protein
LPPVVVSGRAVHHADLVTDLVDEEHDALALVDRGGQLAQRLAHQTGLKAGQAVAHLALDLGARRQGGDGVDHDDVYGTRTHQGVDDLQRLFARVGLRHQQVVQVDAQLLGVTRIERVFGVDEGGGAAGLLDLGHSVQGQRRLARAFRAEHLDHPPARQAADAQRHVEAQRSGRDRGDDVGHPALAQLHHRALAEGAVDLGDRRLKSALLVTVVPCHESQSRLVHGSAHPYSDSGPARVLPPDCGSGPRRPQA